MQFSVTFRHMDATDALKSYAREKLERLQKYFGEPMAVHVKMGAEKRHRHRVDVNVTLRNGLTLAGHETTENMYSSIDLVLAKLERQARKYKQKLIKKRTKPGTLPPLMVPHTVLQEGDEDVEETSKNGHSPLTVRKEEFSALPLTVSEAIMQLNLNHQAFLVFRNEDTGHVNVIYRRGEGEENAYGLIEAGM